MTQEFRPFPNHAQPVKDTASVNTGMSLEEQQASIDNKVAALRERYPDSSLARQQPLATPLHDPGFVQQTPDFVQQDTTLGLHKPTFVPTQQAIAETPYLTSPPVADAEGISIGLPSNFLFYEFKDLFVAPLLGVHLAKLARANAESSLRLTVEAIATTIRTTHPNYVGKSLAHSLSMQDFYFILYFQLQNSFANPSITQRSSCVNPVHLKDVEDGKLDVSTLRITETVRIANMPVVHLEENPARQYEERAQVPLGHYSVGDIIEQLEDPLFRTSEEFRYLARYAGHVKTNMSLRDRITQLDTAPLGQISAIKAYSEAIGNYGVDTKVRVTCGECGASRLTTVSLDAHAFLSN